MNPLLTDIISILDRCPFLYEIAMGHQYKEDPACLWDGRPTMACDGRTVFYHPEVLKWMATQRRGVIVHEWMHTAHLHHQRLIGIPEGDAKLWNIATDAVINPMVKAFGFVLEGGVEIAGAENKSAEQVYHELRKRNPQAKPSPGQGQPGPGRPGPMRPGVPGDPSDQPGDQPADSPTEGEAKAKAVIARMVSGARAAGKLPAGLEQQVKDWLKTKVDWRAVLREYLRRVSRDSWSYARTNRSYATRGLVVPGRHSQSAGDVVIVRDTSGSLFELQKEVASETWSILQEMRPRRTIVIDCDAAVHRVIEIGPGEPLPANTLGGGGTDFRPAFNEVTERGYTPDVLVFITDLEGRFPEEPAPYPVVWALIQAGKAVPPWGQSVKVD
jgi:predicted metal-dependent peptidase